MAQPTIQKLFDSRQVQESLAKWSGVTEPNYYDFIIKHWADNYFKLQSDFADSRQFWNDVLAKRHF